MVVFGYHLCPRISSSRNPTAPAPWGIPLPRTKTRAPEEPRRKGPRPSCKQTPGPPGEVSQRRGQKHQASRTSDGSPNRAQQSPLGHPAPVPEPRNAVSPPASALRALRGRGSRRRRYSSNEKRRCRYVGTPGVQKSFPFRLQARSPASHSIILTSIDVWSK